MCSAGLQIKFYTCLNSCGNRRVLGRGELDESQWDGVGGVGGSSKIDESRWQGVPEPFYALRRNPGVTQVHNLNFESGDSHHLGDG